LALKKETGLALGNGGNIIPSLDFRLTDSI